MVGNCYQKVSLTKVSSSIDEGQKRLPPIVMEQKEAAWWKVTSCSPASCRRSLWYRHLLPSLVQPCSHWAVTTVTAWAPPHLWPGWPGQGWSHWEGDSWERGRPGDPPSPTLARQ